MSARRPPLAPCRIPENPLASGMGVLFRIPSPRWKGSRHLGLLEPVVLRCRILGRRRDGCLHGREAVAPLKRLVVVAREQEELPSPRPRGRGSVEAWKWGTRRSAPWLSPRPRGRGSVVASTAAPLVGALSRLHGREAVAPLKHGFHTKVEHLWTVVSRNSLKAACGRPSICPVPFISRAEWPLHGRPLKRRRTRMRGCGSCSRSCSPVTRPPARTATAPGAGTPRTPGTARSARPPPPAASPRGPRRAPRPG